MLDCPSLRQTAFVLPHCHHPLRRLPCQPVRPKSSALKVCLLPVQITKFCHDPGRLRHSSFTTLKSRASLLHHPSRGRRVDFKNRTSECVSVCEFQNSDNSSVQERCSDEPRENILSTMGNSLTLVPVFEQDEKLKGIAVSGHDGEAMFVQLRRSGCIPEQLIDALESNSIEKCGCSLRQLYKYLVVEHDVTMNGTLFDAHIALDLLNVNQRQIRDLVAVTGLGEGVYEMLSNRASSIPKYPVDRSISLCRLLTELIPILRQSLRQQGLLFLALRVEFPLIRVLGSMEIRGVPVDRTELGYLRTRCNRRLSRIEDNITDLATHVSQSTNKKYSSNIFDTCLAQYHKANKAYNVVAKPTATRGELARMISSINLPNVYRVLASLFVEYEDLSKFIDRDLEPLSRHLQSDGRIRTTFVQGSCRTGRLSARNPNLQNIPVRSRLGRELRNAFRAEEGMSLIRADYSQIELRIVASLCGDPFMIDAFSSGVDIHKCIASKIFDIPTTDVTNTQRNQAKQIIYSILYGVSSAGLSERLAVTVRAAENLLSEFKIEFPSVQALANQLIEEAARNGYAKTLLGRRLPLPMLALGEPSERRAASRKAINMPIQGTQADMIKLSMIRIHERLRANGATSAIVLQVHDELILEVPDSEIEAVGCLVEEEMISALPLTGVDVAVQIRYGPSWSRCLKRFSRG